MLDEEEESTDSSSSEGDSDRSLPAVREVVPARRRQSYRGRHAQHSDKPHSREPITQRGAQHAERPQRKRRPPVWMHSSDWQVGYRPYMLDRRHFTVDNRQLTSGDRPFTITVRPEDVVDF